MENWRNSNIKKKNKTIDDIFHLEVVSGEQSYLVPTWISRIVVEDNSIKMIGIPPKQVGGPMEVTLEMIK